MSIVNMVFIAIALAMDALAVAISAGVTLRQVSFRQVFRLSWHFGLFQAMMPVIGWSAGLSVKNLIENYDHWVAFGLLSFVACNMLREAFQDQDEEKEKKDPTKGFTLVLLSIATSIDALAVGFSISVLNVSIWTPALIIGLVAGFFTVAGLQIGKIIGSAGILSRYAEVAGALVLLVIGFKILYEHGALTAII